MTDDGCVRYRDGDRWGFITSHRDGSCTVRWDDGAVEVLAPCEQGPARVVVVGNRPAITLRPRVGALH